MLARSRAFAGSERSIAVSIVGDWEVFGKGLLNVQWGGKYLRVFKEPSDCRTTVIP